MRNRNSEISKGEKQAKLRYKLGKRREIMLRYFNFIQAQAPEGTSVIQIKRREEF
jgi:hypothetical protein